MSLSIDGFTEVTPLAGGGFGSVYKATRASTGGVVAVKVLDRAHGDDEDLLERRLRREIAALVALKGHPNVVQVEEVVTTANGPAIVMEFMAAGSVLDSDIAGKIKASRVAFIGAAAASGLQAAHDVGIVHRDVKPQNVLVNTFGQVKLCDFGIAAIQRSAEFQTRTTALSVRYASPEELDNDPDIGAPTDVYSLGASMFHMLYGDPPSFRGGRGADPSLTRSKRGVNKVIDRVTMLIDECLSENPADRPTANDCFGILSNLDLDPKTLAREPAPAPKPKRSTSKESPISERRRRRAEAQADVTEEKPDRSVSGNGTSDPDSSPSEPDRSPAPGRNQPDSTPGAPPPNSAPPPDPSGPHKPLPATSNERWWT